VSGSDRQLEVQHGRLCDKLWKTSIILGLLAATLVFVFPSLDRDVSRAFYLHGSGFVGHHSPAIQFVRASFTWLFSASCGLVVVGLLVTLIRGGTCLHLRFAQWMFLGLCFAVGPGLLANAILKGHWGRARPVEIVEFGGTKAYTPALTPSDQCARNCSFVSGEASSTFTLFFATALVVPQWSAGLALVGILAGLADGLVRISQGAHFMSDVLFAGIFMALSVAALFTLLFRISWPSVKLGFSKLKHPKPS
jgi:lipid A 4'-phosphatase